GGLLGALLAAVPASAIPQPTADPFYTPPAHLPRYAPGTILRSRAVTIKGLSNAGSRTAYQLLYRTTDATRRPIASVTTLLLPSRPAPGPRQLRSYQPAADSLTTKCTPPH